MAGTLVADVLQDGAGNSTSMDNAIYGSAKAWVNYNGVAQTITASYNISSVTYNSTGSYIINFTSAFTDNKYVTLSTATNAPSTASVIMNSNANSSGTPTAPTTTACYVFAQSRSTGAAIDSAYISVACFR